MKFLKYILIILTQMACNKANKNDMYFSFLPSSQTGITFNNIISENDSINFYNNEYMYIGSGVGVGDFNNDNLQDVFFGASQVGPKLYLNKGDFMFEDITEKSGIRNSQWIIGVSVVDINQDGWLDVYLCVSHFKDPLKRKNLLYINSPFPGRKIGGEIRFIEQAESYGLADMGFSTQSAFLDYDNDGDLDMYLLNHKLFEPQPNRLVPIDSTGNSVSADKLYRNDYPANHFTDISKEAGILEDGYGLGVTATDFNHDGYTDIYVANDYLSNDYFWQNDGKGHFKNIIASATKHQAFSSMGVDAADINNDLKPDFMVLDMMPFENGRKKMMVLGFTPEKFEMQRNLGYHQQFSRNMLQIQNGLRSNGEPYFSEIGHLAGIAETDWSWSVLFADFDNDTHKDIHITNGLARDLTNNDFIAFTQEQQENIYSFGGGSNLTTPLSKVKEWTAKLAALGAVEKTNFLFKNNSNLEFSEISKESGIEQKSVSHGAAYADFDNDGDLDLVVNNMNSEAFVMRNELRKSILDSKNNFLQIRLKGPKKNLSGIGAKVTVFANNEIQYQEVNPVRGYASSISINLNFGLEGSIKADSLKIFWPDGKIETIKNQKANTILTLEYANAKASGSFFKKNDSNIIFWETEIPEFVHQEIPFFDYYIHRMQPQKYSQLGPCLGIADLNSDGLEDVFVGGAAWQSPKIYFQNSKGKYNIKTLPQKPDEDLSVSFIDIDLDKDLDILVAGGSSEYTRDFISKPRVYLNDGKGGFTQNISAFPDNFNLFASIIAPYDFDNDGDEDLFIGARIDKEKYPASPKSYFFRNDNGNFKDITTTICPALNQVGMVTAATWINIDSNPGKELILAGDWMNIKVFKLKSGKLSEISNDLGFENLSGMYRALSGSDIDKDGDLDLVVGNFGLNNKFHVSQDRPYHLYAKDLDQSGKNEILPAYFMKNSSGKYNLYPDFDRHQIAEQTPVIKKKYLLHSDFSKTTMPELLKDFGNENLIDLKCQEMASFWLENDGNGKFKKHFLPTEAQFSPVNAILIYDFNFDGHKDILLAGNEYQTEVSTGRMDASFGVFLKGDKNKIFKAQSSGFLIEGDVKSLVLSAEKVWVGINNQKLKAFGFTHDSKKN